MGRDLVAGLGDEQSAVVVQKMNGTNLVFLGHHRRRLANEPVGLFNEIVQQVIDVVCNAGGGFFFLSQCRGERLQCLLRHAQR